MMLTVQEAMQVINDHKRVAIVGLSPKEDRPSYIVGKFLIEQGFEVTPVNPGHSEILGRKSVKTLSEISRDAIDWIDLFVNPGRLNDLLPEIIALSPKLVWCQLGVVNESFNQALEQASIPYIADVCPKMEWGKY